MKPALSITYTDIDLASLYSFPMGMALIELASADSDKKNALKHLREAKSHLLRVLDANARLGADQILESPLLSPDRPPYAVIIAVVQFSDWLRALIKLHAGAQLSVVGDIRKGDAMEVIAAIDATLKE